MNQRHRGPRPAHSYRGFQVNAARGARRSHNLLWHRRALGMSRSDYDRAASTCRDYRPGVAVLGAERHRMVVEDALKRSLTPNEIRYLYG
jgi:hypothetical protein